MGEALVVAINGVIEKMKAILIKANELRNSSIEGFVNKDIKILGGLIGVYAKCFDSLNVTTRSRFDDLVKKQFRNVELQTSFEDLLKAEEDWATFLEETDHLVNLNVGEKVENQSLRVLDNAPLPTSLIDARTGRYV